MTDMLPKPMHPYAILALAIVLPGSGHVFSGVPARGLQFLFFIIVIGWATSKIAPHRPPCGRRIYLRAIDPRCL
jgi:hypothetical protein